MTNEVERQAKRLQKWGFRILLTEFVLTLGVAMYFAVVTDQQNSVLANTALQQSQATEQVIQEVRQDLNIHATASADRVCSVAKELEFLALNPPTVGGMKQELTRTPHELHLLKELVDEACLVVPIGPGR